MYNNDSKPVKDPANKYHSETQKPAPEPQRKPLRHNPRLVFTNPDDFFSDLLMEQQEQQ